MQVWYLDSKGQLQLVEREQPQPGRGQVLVKIHAASLNHRDLYIRSGMRAGSGDAPLIPLSDGAGEVAAVGEGCDRFQVGDRVALTFFPAWIDGPPREELLPARGDTYVPGVLAEAVVVDEHELVALPQHLSYAEGATLPCAGVTAWHALVSGQLQAGETVLLLGTGGVSLFGLQIAKAAGARSIVISRHEEKLARVRSFGADETINSTVSPQWDEQVLALTDGRGVDHVLEVGGVETLPLSLKAIRLAGRVDLIGGLAGFVGPIELGLIRQRLAIVQSFYVGNRTMFEEMNAFISQHQIRPIVDCVFPFEQAPQAFEYLAAARHVGKVVIGR